MDRTRIAAFATSTLVAVAAAAGCGSPKPLTRAQLTSRADAICRGVKAKLEAASKGQSVSTPQQIERLTAKLSSFEQTALAELGELVPPRALEDDWKRFVAAAGALAEYTAKVGEYAAAKNAAATKRVIASAESAQKQITVVAKRMGLKDCEQVP